jgi:hypothetical protein
LKAVFCVLAGMGLAGRPCVPSKPFGPHRFALWSLVRVGVPFERGFLPACPAAPKNLGVGGRHKYLAFLLQHRAAPFFSNLPRVMITLRARAEEQKRKSVIHTFQADTQTVKAMLKVYPKAVELCKETLVLNGLWDESATVKKPRAEPDSGDIPPSVPPSQAPLSRAPPNPGPNEPGSGSSGSSLGADLGGVSVGPGEGEDVAEDIEDETQLAH